jgi:hypothetical protein
VDTILEVMAGELHADEIGDGGEQDAFGGWRCSGWRGLETQENGAARGRLSGIDRLQIGRICSEVNVASKSCGSRGSRSDMWRNTATPPITRYWTPALVSVEITR